MPSRLIAFYRGEGPDSEGRRLDDILAWDDERLERVHDFIQWLFPLPEASGVNPDAPLLTSEDAREFRGDPGLRARLRAAFERMVAFYSFVCREDGMPVVERSACFEQRKGLWLRPGNHNHLRITRILRSATLLGCEGHARAFLVALDALDPADSATIGPVTRGYWSRAGGPEVRCAPSDRGL